MPAPFPRHRYTKLEAAQAPLLQRNEALRVAVPITSCHDSCTGRFVCGVVAAALPQGKDQPPSLIACRVRYQLVQSSATQRLPVPC